MPQATAKQAAHPAEQQASLPLQPQMLQLQAPEQESTSFSSPKGEGTTWLNFFIDVQCPTGPPFWMTICCGTLPEGPFGSSRSPANAATANKTVHRTAMNRIWNNFRVCIEPPPLRKVRLRSIDILAGKR